MKSFCKQYRERCPPECPFKCGHNLKLREHPEIPCLRIPDAHLYPYLRSWKPTIKVGATCRLSCYLLTTTCYLYRLFIMFTCYRPDPLSLLPPHSLHITQAAIWTKPVSAVRYSAA